MMELMDGAPYEFTLHASPEELRPLGHFVHRTFNGTDFIAFVLALRRLCTVWGGIGQFFEERYAATGDLRIVLAEFRREFFACDHPVRCEKHVSSIERKASCKRLNMYLRWMVRDDGRGVDFIFRYCNAEMEKVEGVPVEEMLNRSFYEVFRNGDKKWLVSYADVALNGTKHTIHDYSPEIDKNLIIHCYQPEPGYCACVLQVADS